MDSVEQIYEDMFKESLHIVQLWRLKKSRVALFVEKLQNESNLLVHYRLGTIVEINKDKPYFNEVGLRFVLNNEVFETETIFYDDRQFFIRTVGEERIRRINLNVIKEIHLDGKVFNARQALKELE